MEESTLRDIEVKKDFIKFMESRIAENEAENLRLKENIKTTKKLIEGLCDCSTPEGKATWNTFSVINPTCRFCGKYWYLWGER